MRRRSRNPAKRQSIVEPILEKPLLRLHAAIHIDSFWKAIRETIDAALPNCFVGLTLQHTPIFPRIVRSTEKVLNGFFPIAPIQNYFAANPRRQLVQARDIFSDERKFKMSLLYRNCMAPVNGRYATGLFFWNSGRLLAVIVIMRSAAQGPFSQEERRVLRQLYPQFRTALERLRLLERGHAVRVTFEQFMRRVPLPTVVLRWNLRVVYQNQAASDFCSLWQRGPEQARLIKSKAPLPPEILDRCRLLKKRWEQLDPLDVRQTGFGEERVHHPKRRHLRATINLKQISSVGVARPHFLIEFEKLTARHELPDRGLPHLARLTRREQELARLVCDGRSNQEIADDSSLSLETVKKHLHSVFRKLEVSSRSRLIALIR
jgi:DNA-binding CsgD family transcriptional regulator